MIKNGNMGHEIEISYHFVERFLRIEEQELEDRSYRLKRSVSI